MGDDIQKALSNLDLGAVVNDIQAQQADKEPVKEPTQQQTTQDLDLGQFKNPKDLLKSYKEIQGAFTRITQEKKASEQKMKELEEQLELLKNNPAQQVYPPPQVPQKAFDQQFMENPEAAIVQQISKVVATQRIAEVLEEEADKNKPEFQERYAYAQMVAREYPNLSQSAQGVKKLFQLGDKLRTEQLKKSAGKALESIFGEPLAEEEINRLRTLVKGDKQAQKLNNTSNAYMPDTSTSIRSGATTDQSRDASLEINESIRKGDVDGVLKAKFASLLAE